jgi:hypothetical protein
MSKPTDYQKHYCASNQRENEFVKTSPFLHSSGSIAVVCGLQEINGCVPCHVKL